MKIKRLFMYLLIAISITACTQPNNVELSGDEPPVAMVQIEDQTYATKLGSYCWSSKNHAKCVDAVGPVELLEGSSPITVAPEEVISFVMDYEPLPTKFHLSQMTDDDYAEINMNGLQFSAPIKEGIYYYSMGVWWMDEERENVANGSASYIFAIDVR